MDRRKRIGVRARGSGIQIDFQYRGVRCRETLQLPPTKANLRYADNKRSTILFEIEKGTFRYSEHFPSSPRAQMFGEPVRITVGDALDQFLDSKLRTRELSTYRGYKSAVEYHLRPEFGEMLLNEFTTARIREWIASVEISNKSINNVLIPLRGICADAFSDGVIDRDPMARIQNLSHRSPEPDPFSLDEVRKILAAAERQVLNFFQFAFFTGLRTSELIAIEWSDVELDKSVAHIRRAIVLGQTKRPKTVSSERDVVLLEPAIEALKAQQPITRFKAGRIFYNPKTGKPWAKDEQIRNGAWKPIMKRAGVRYRSAYNTRHTYASMMLTAGENPMWVAHQMGHSDWGMIRKRYGRWIPDIDRSGGQKLMAVWSQSGHEEHASG